MASFKEKSDGTADFNAGRELESSWIKEAIVQKESIEQKAKETIRALKSTDEYI